MVYLDNGILLSQHSNKDLMFNLCAMTLYTRDIMYLGPMIYILNQNSNEDNLPFYDTHKGYAFGIN